MVCYNYANIYSTTTAPLAVNSNEIVPMTNIDTNSWKINADGSISCCNAGTWQIISQYQLVTLNSVDLGADATLEGWFNLNGSPIANSAATTYASKRGGNAVLTIAINQTFKKGDKLSFGVRSNNTTSSTLNVVAQGFTSASGVYAPSCIVTAIKI